MMADNVDAAEQISTLLDNAKYKEALAVSSDEKHLQSFKNNCGDVLTTVIGKIKDDTALTKPSLQSACEELLNLVVQKVSPEEALLEFIEQTEIAKNDAQFCIILSPLQQLLKKLSAKRGMSLEWCLNSISTYIENIPIPEYNLEDKERLLMDCDPNIRRIIKVYSEIPTFYSPFVKELSAPNANVKTKQIVTAFLISLLGKPLIYLDLDPENNATSEARKCCATIVQDICVVEKNVLKFLMYLENCSRDKNKPKSKINNFDKDHETPPYEQKEKVNMDTLSGLFYAVFSGHFQIPDMSIPQVYSIEFIVNTAMFASLHFLSFTEFGPLTKAVALAKVLLGSLPDNLPHTHLSSIHVDLLKKLTNVAIYSVYQTIRKTAVNLIGFTVNKFEYKGRCLLIKCLLEVSNHSGMMGYATTLYKNSIDEAFKSSGPFPDCLSGAQLLSMLKKMCHLPHGPESDIVELADQIITTLNFLRYLAIKDVNNVTGITDCFSYIESHYLEKLRVGLNMSKAHYEVKLKDIEDKKVLPTIDVSINVCGNPLDDIPTEQKKEIIHSALNAFHLIEGLIARVSECININKLQGLTMDCA